MFAIDALRIRNPAAAAPAGHRYWRLLFPSGSSDTTNHRLGIAEMELRETIGGADATTTDPGSTKSAASSQFSGSFTARQAFDGVTSGFNGWLSANSSDTNSWISWDFGAGVTKNIVEIKIWAFDSGSGTTGPKEITLQYSDNNSSWTTALVVSGGPYTWTDGQNRVFNS